MSKSKKRYRVSSNEHFNLMSMMDKVMVQVYEARENGTIEEMEAAEARMDEMNNLLEKAPCVGALVDWPTLARIREIAATRETMRDQACAMARNTRT